MTRYTNFGSFVQRTEYLNEMRRQEEIDDGTTNNSLVSARLSPVPPQAPPPPGATAARPPSVEDSDPALASGSVAGMVG